MKKKIFNNYRVEAIPIIYWGKEPDKRDCQKLAEEINRHCDCERAVIVYDTTEVCEFCEEKWEIDDDGCPLCCNKAIKEFEDLKKEV